MADIDRTALWELAERRAKKDAELMYPPEEEKMRRMKEAELTVLYYHQLVCH